MHPDFDLTMYLSFNADERYLYFCSNSLSNCVDDLLLRRFSLYIYSFSECYHFSFLLSSTFSSTHRQ